MHGAAISWQESVAVTTQRRSVRSSWHREPEAALQTRRVAARHMRRGRVSVTAASETQNEGPVMTIPTRLNNVPHLRETRHFFYDDVTRGVRTALADGQSRLSLHLTIPETNPEMDVYRVGTVLEMVRTVALSLTEDGATVKVCVQQSMGEGVFQGLPLSLAGVRKIMEVMDWGDTKEFVQFGEVRASEVDDVCSYYLLIAPQNIVGSTIMTDLKEMVEKVEEKGKQMVLINARLGDIPSSAGIMGVRGRKERMAFSNSFAPAYHFRLLYSSGTFFPIKGALRYTYGSSWEVFKRMRYGKKEEGYELCGSYDAKPSAAEITTAIRQKKTSDRFM